VRISGRTTAYYVSIGPTTSLVVKPIFHLFAQAKNLMSTRLSTGSSGFRPDFRLDRQVESGL